MALVVGAAILAACGGVRVHRLTDTEYAAREEDAPVELFVGQLTRPHESLALVDSRRYSDKEPATRERMLEDLRGAARRLGGEGVHEIRLLAERRRGAVRDPKVPIFGAWHQGDYFRYFLRGEVVRYLESPEKIGETAGAAEQGAGADATRALEPATAGSVGDKASDEGKDDGVPGGTD